MTNSDQQSEIHSDEWDEEIHSDEMEWGDLIFEIFFEEQADNNEWGDLILANFFLNEIQETMEKRNELKKIMKHLM
jgi:hypothetical protein